MINAPQGEKMARVAAKLYDARDALRALLGDLAAAVELKEPSISTEKA